MACGYAHTGSGTLSESILLSSNGIGSIDKHKYGDLFTSIVFCALSEKFNIYLSKHRMAKLLHVGTSFFFMFVLNNNHNYHP